MKKCSNTKCNREFSDDMAFCPYCGIKWIPSKRKCPNPDCSFDNIPDDANFCPNCRLKLEGNPVNTGNPHGTLVGQGCTLSPVIQRLINNMVHVEGGTFTMGATSWIERPLVSVKPYQVTLSSFSICKYEVTQEEWEAVMGSNPSKFKGAKLPVEKVSWNDCRAFLRKMNALTGKKFRLPTEVEWEYAARGGNKSRGYKYAEGNDLGDVAWSRTTPEARPTLLGRSIRTSWGCTT